MPNPKKTVAASNYHRLRWLSVVGGFMDGTRIEFAPGLNCIIGARGTGKTTVLGFIRFALDAMPDDAAACKRIEGLVNRNLDFGRVELGIETKDGLAYVVSRTLGEDSVVLSDDGEPTEITLKAGGFFAADIFSQNEVESIADRSLSQLELIDTFDTERIADLNVQIKHVGVQLSGNANAIQPFQARIATHQAAMGQATEQSRLEKVRNGFLAKKRERDEAISRLTKLQAERAALLKKLSERRDARFGIRNALAERIHAALSPTIRVSIVQDEDRSLYRQFIEGELGGAGIKQGPVAQKIVNALWPTDLAGIVKSGNVTALVEKAELNASQAEKVVAALQNSGRLHDFETIGLIDQPKIELNDSGHYKESQSLSTGQKCTTILPILLVESEKPLLVDQPEDNLDNRFISQTVVGSPRKVKSRRQLIFVTHSPNIPVLGDAAKVFVLESDGTTARLAKDGTVDACKAEIVTLLEGGDEAFRQLKERYKY